MGGQREASEVTDRVAGNVQVTSRVAGNVQSSYPEGDDSFANLSIDVKPLYELPHHK